MGPLVLISTRRSSHRNLSLERKRQKTVERLSSLRKQLDQDDFDLSDPSELELMISKLQQRLEKINRKRRLVLEQQTKLERVQASVDTIQMEMVSMKGS